MRPLILGEDFLQNNQIGIYYSEIGKCILEQRHQELVSAVEMQGSPTLVSFKVDENTWKNLSCSKCAK